MIIRPKEMDSTADIVVPSNPFERIIGQERAVSLVRSAVTQRRHVLLCGVPGIGKSMIAKAAYTLLPAPKEDILLKPNTAQPERPLVKVLHTEEVTSTESNDEDIYEERFIHPDELPFETAVKMGYRCQRCGSFASPTQDTCMDCGTPKRTEPTGRDAYQGLFRALSVLREPALGSVTTTVETSQGPCRITYQRTGYDAIRVTAHVAKRNPKEFNEEGPTSARVLVSRTSSRFIRVSGTSPVELLGDVKHDPYGSSKELAMAPHLRVVPGAIHEAHEGVLYVDEMGALGSFQKHLLTAMQDRRYPISGHNPLSSGAAVRVDDVPCDFLLFASCNLEDFPKILPALRSRIRGYGYEIMLSSWTSRTPVMENAIVGFIAQTVAEDGRIPHFDTAAVDLVLNCAERMALELDGKKNALTLRLRELGGIVRIAGDLAVRDNSDLAESTHVDQAESLSQDLLVSTSKTGSRAQESYGDYFF